MDVPMLFGAGCCCVFTAVDAIIVIRDGESDTVPRTLSLRNEISREDICVLGTQMAVVTNITR